MKNVLIVQARTTSTRLPGKVLMEISGAPMLAQQLRRLKRCKRVDEIVVATTANTTDNPVVELAKQEGVAWYRGSEADVLKRFVETSKDRNADLVVRITADCPLIDSEVVDETVKELEVNHSHADYASNVLNRTYPIGLDCEAFFIDTLLRVDRLATRMYDREHVTTFVYKTKPDLFLTKSISDSENNSDLRWTVDFPEDLERIRSIYHALNLQNNQLSYRDIIRYVRSNLKK